MTDNNTPTPNNASTFKRLEDMSIEELEELAAKKQEAIKRRCLINFIKTGRNETYV